MTDKMTLIRAGMVVANELGADTHAKIMIAPPFMNEYMSMQYDRYSSMENIERIKLRRWTNGIDTFNIGYSENHKTVILAFPEET